MDLGGLTREGKRARELTDAYISRSLAPTTSFRANSFLLHNINTIPVVPAPIVSILPADSFARAWAACFVTITTIVYKNGHMRHLSQLSWATHSGKNHGERVHSCRAATTLILSKKPAVRRIVFSKLHYPNVFLALFNRNESGGPSGPCAGGQACGYGESLHHSSMCCPKMKQKCTQGASRCSLQETSGNSSVSIVRVDQQQRHQRET